MTINIVNLVGYVEQYPDVCFFEDGQFLCMFSIMLRSGRFNGEELFESIDLEIWNKTAELAIEYISPGRLIGITGSLNFSSSPNQETEKPRRQLIILVNKIYIFSSKLALHKDEEEEENEEEFEPNYYPEYEEYDTSIDYGYLDDIDSIYEQFHSLGNFE